jgi:gamma-glutamyltranspeptidase
MFLMLMYTWITTCHCNVLSGGDVINNPALAETLRQIALDPEYLHTTMAATLADEIQAAGGIITAAEITAYATKIRDAVEYDIFGHEIYSSPPPSSGGLIVLAILQFMEGFDEPMASQEEVHVQLTLCGIILLLRIYLLTLRYCDYWRTNRSIIIILLKR